MLSGSNEPIFQIRNNSNQIFEFSLEQDARRVDDPLKCQQVSISFTHHASAIPPSHSPMRC